MSASRTGISERPVSVSEYSTRGGTSENTSRCTRWLRSRFFSVCESIFCEQSVISNFYKFLMERVDTKAFGLKKSSKIKAFGFKFISVPAKWIRTSRHYELNIYTSNHAYKNAFAITDG